MFRDPWFLKDQMQLALVSAVDTSMRLNFPAGSSLSWPRSQIICRRKYDIFCNCSLKEDITYLNATCANNKIINHVGQKIRTFLKNTVLENPVICLACYIPTCFRILTLTCRPPSGRLFRYWSRLSLLSFSNIQTSPAQIPNFSEKTFRCCCSLFFFCHRR